MNEFPKRKRNRLQEFDYNTPGAYFITVCTVKRQNYFWKNVGATIGRPSFPQDVQLSVYGKIVEESIRNIAKIYPSLTIDQYVIMPDHIHLLLEIRDDENGRPMAAPTISRVVQQMKGYVTKRIGTSVWQKLFYDHIIRNRADYEKHVKYIYENPARWCDGELYADE